MKSRMRRPTGGSEVVILGGGLTGISAARHLTRRWLLLYDIFHRVESQ